MAVFFIYKHKSSTSESVSKEKAICPTIVVMQYVNNISCQPRADSNWGYHGHRLTETI